ncbi:uncharacterized protein EI90DRAFT_3174996 [Cantharellus anzutake]|uniref:uncharacterized protein n=1 Tax=Cantharellus anzutake TaxID=1750568 RepID=UPI001902E89F|nr:uncharacterized protein EI90DRAFT_3174996 [Cantharellus anzutake]KAF8315506.1 hypothetical protein EI90DRAFT_3174996 [Cantharellus anzutake]
MWRSLEKESNEVYAGEALEHAKLVPADLTVLHPEYVQAKKSNLNYEMAKIHWSFALEIGVEGEGTPSIHNAAVKATTKGASKAGQTELAMETVKLFDCSTISRMIKESMSWWSLLQCFVPLSCRKSSYTFTSGVTMEPYSPQRHHEYQQKGMEIVGQVNTAREQQDTTLVHLNQINQEIETLVSTKMDLEARCSGLDLEEEWLDENEGFIHERAFMDPMNFHETS